MAKTEIAVAELIWNLIAGKTGNASDVTFFPQKPAFPEDSPEGEGRRENGAGESGNFFGIFGRFLGSCWEQKKYGYSSGADCKEWAGDL